MHCLSTALMVGFIQTLANSAFIAATIVYFFTSSKLTKFRSKRKTEHDEEAAKGKFGIVYVLVKIAPVQRTFMIRFLCIGSKLANQDIVMWLT